jgi:hypothetical protein
MPPNEPNELYAGPIDFTQKGATFRLEGRISLVWLPSPKVRFDVPSVPAGVNPELGDISLKLEDGTSISRAQVTGRRSGINADEGYSASFSGIIGEWVVRPADGPVHHAFFLLPNFQAPLGQSVRYPDDSTSMGRLTLRGGGWLITLDQVPEEKTFMDFLASRSGFGITHVGRLERDDGSPFTAEDGLDVLNALRWYGSFAAGRWIGPYLPTGFDIADKQVWQVWYCARTVAFHNRPSWLDPNHGGQFEAPFPGFMRLWLDKDWEEVVRLAMHWYIEANAQAGSIEGSIVLTQNALELLASAVLVEHSGQLSAKAYEKVAAADRILLLFRWMGLPIAIPAELTHLLQQAKADHWPDTATAMTMIRNKITHPTKKNRGKLARYVRDVRIEAWKLGLWNLELCLLRLFDYRGEYANRITQKYVGEVETVPWAQPAVT